VARPGGTDVGVRGERHAFGRRRARRIEEDEEDQVGVRTAGRDDRSAGRIGTRLHDHASAGRREVAHEGDDRPVVVAQAPVDQTVMLTVQAEADRGDIHFGARGDVFCTNINAYPIDCALGVRGWWDRQVYV